MHAAWEVYTVQKDKDDFIDSLARIVRDLDFDEDGVIPELKPSTAAAGPSSEANKKNAATSTQTAAPSNTKPAAPAPSTAKPAAAAPAPSVAKASTAASTKKGESPSMESSSSSSQQEGRMQN